MKAVGFTRSLPVSDPDSLRDVDLPVPVATGRDILVSVRAVSVNPVDTKVRRSALPETGPLRVAGYDAAGVVEAVGEGVNLFAPGDRVFYAGALDRQGSNAEYQLVDERLVARMPDSLGFAQAAALPLTALTAWELLFDRLQVPRDQPGTLLVIGGAGGVGSVLVQLARKLTRLTVVATASRPESRDWCLRLGAHHVVDHGGSLAAAWSAARTQDGQGLAAPAYVACLTHTDRHWADVAALVAPQGKVALIDDPEAIDIRLLKRKSVSLHWEFMFTRSLFATDDMIAQHRILTEVANLVDDGVLSTTLAGVAGRITAEDLRQAHARLESGSSIGKLVLEGF